MIPDSSTKEGMEEILRRSKKSKEFTKKMRELTGNSSDEEPSGKHTHPSEIDRHRDRKNDFIDF